MLILDKVAEILAMAKEIDFSNLPLPICAATEFTFRFSNPNSLVVITLSIGKEEPYPAAEPKGF